MSPLVGGNAIDRLAVSGAAAWHDGCHFAASAPPGFEK